MWDTPTQEGHTALKKLMDFTVAYSNTRMSSNKYIHKIQRKDNPYLENVG